LCLVHTEESRSRQGHARVTSVNNTAYIFPIASTFGSVFSTTASSAAAAAAVPGACDRQTDGQTDRHTTSARRTFLSIRNVSLLLLLLFFDPGTQFPVNEKITLCNTNIFYHYYAAFNAPCIGHKDDESHECCL